MPNLVNPYIFVSAFVDPNSISGCVGWFDASDSGTITEVSGSVSQWDDKSPIAKHASQVTGSKQPTTGTRTINSLNALDFDGGDSLISSSYDAFSGEDLPFSIFIVYQLDSVGAVNHIEISKAADTEYFRTDFSGTNKYKQSIADSGGPVAGLISTVLADTVLHLRTDLYTGTVWDTYVDTTNVRNSSVDRGTLGTLDQLVIASGNSNGTNSRFMNGMIGEIVIYDTKLSSNDVDNVENYLNDKWSIY